ncbi:hypothetical protein L0337_06390 [candidate division KSB1 bacterium]|nr:hypothetical protein [candidate division KSB1 bacterium]
MNHRRVGKGFLLLLLLSPVFLLLWSCGKGPTKANVKEANQPPETYVSSTSLTKTPAVTDASGAVTNLTEFVYSVDYTGVDTDGKVDSFAVRVDGGPWSAWTDKRKTADTLDFASLDAAHIIEIKALDNEGAEDPSPAKATLSLALFAANKPPTTAIPSGPPDGATSGRGVRFEASGADADGKVTSFAYSLDGGGEQKVAADANGKAVIEFSRALGNLLSPGNHSLAVTSIDNLGARDQTPATSSFFVGSGLKPVLALTSTVGPPSAAGAWFTGVNVPFAWSVSMAHYFGILDHFEYSLDDPVNFTSTNTAQVSFAAQSAGPHTFRVRAVDTGENVSDILTVNFTVTEFAPANGILFIDNVDTNPSTTAYANEPDMDQKILNGFFKNFTRVSVWDVDRLSGGERFPGANNTTALPGPADLAKFSSVVIMTDSIYTASAISGLLAAYFQAGGNLMITGFRTVNFAQTLRNAMATPAVLTARGTVFQSLEGYQAASADNSNAYAFISGADVIPVIAGAAARDWERMNNSRPTSLRILFANVGAGGAQGGDRIATEAQGAKGNWGVWLGMSLFYLDQTSTGIVKLGDFILGNRFKER